MIGIKSSAMNKKLVIFSILMAIGFFGVAQGTLPKGYRFKNSNLNIFATTPPALIYITDNEGNRTGADPSGSMTSYGFQGPKPWSGLSEIPLSQSIQQTNFDESNPNATITSTNWDISIYDGGRQTYTINLLGKSTGTEEIAITGIYPKGSGKGTRAKFNVLVNAGQTRQITVAFDPSQKSIMTTPIVNNGDLLNDIKSACAQNLIEYRECDFLQAKAELIQKALDRKEKKEAEKLIKSFLCNLGELKGDGDDDRDDRDAIKEPALTVLVNDAKALLKTLAEDDRR